MSDLHLAQVFRSRLIRPAGPRYVHLTAEISRARFGCYHQRPGGNFRCHTEFINVSTPFGMLAF